MKTLALIRVQYDILWYDILTWREILKVMKLNGAFWRFYARRPLGDPIVLPTHPHLSFLLQLLTFYFSHILRWSVGPGLQGLKEIRRWTWKINRYETIPKPTVQNDIDEISTIEQLKFVFIVVCRRRGSFNSLLSDVETYCNKWGMKLNVNITAW